MARLSQAQIEMYARSAGLSADRAKVAAAIAMAESGGNPRSHNPVPPDNSYGLWQINMLGSMGPTRRKQLGISSNEELYDPAVNARAMAQISSGGSNWQPWATYTGPDGKGADGPWRQYYDGAAPPVEGGIEQADLLPDFAVPGLDALTDAFRGINASAELAVGLAEWVSNAHNWVRVAQVLAGGLLVGVGISVAVRQQLMPVISPIANTVTDAVPGGAAVKKSMAAKKSAKAAKSAPKAAPSKAPAKSAPAVEAAA